MNQIPGRLIRRDGCWFEAGAGFRLPVATAPLPPGGAPERAVVLGIRPEDIRPTTDPAGFEAVVSEIEPLGHEVLVTVEVGGVSLILRGDAGLPVSLGRPLRWVVDSAAMHWFDHETGSRLG